jgi:two-component system, NtrC family, sensor kinase
MPLPVAAVGERRLYPAIKPAVATEATVQYRAPGLLLGSGYLDLLTAGLPVVYENHMAKFHTDEDVALWSFLDELRMGLRAMRDDQKALRFSLRQTCEHFKVGDGCLAVLPPDRLQAELVAVIPRGSQWDLSLLAALLRKQRASIPANIIIAPISRRGRLWAALALRRQQQFESHAARALLRIARVISESIELIDWHRIAEVRARIDRKIMEQLRPQDLFYQILHGLRSLTYYDHSSALLICDERANALDLVAEQIAWIKGKSHRIGLRLPLTEDLWNLMRDTTVYAFHRQDGEWEESLGQKSTALARLLDYNFRHGTSSGLRESAMLCAPLATRDGVLGVLKVAARHPSLFGRYEADLLQRFIPLAAVAIQNSQRTVTLEAKMLEAEKKHAIANLMRGVSHDVNNALGSVLPLVQQISEDAASGRLQKDVLCEDLEQVEQSIQTCRRIFGGMLALARGVTQGSPQANLRRAVDSTLSILKDGFERQGIKLDLRLMDVLPNIRAAQGDLEQLFLNLATNAKDAMPVGGTLTIHTERLGEKVRIVIRDTGCGIAAEHMSSIQEPFFTTKAQGNGLGLSICRSIVWNVGGQMKIESEPGVGTEIGVLLPIVDEKGDGTS